MQVAVAVLQAATAEEFYDAERGVAALLRERADAVVAAILAYWATAAEFVEPARRLAHEAARKQGVRLVSNGHRKTRVQLLGGLLVTLVTLRMRPVQQWAGEALDKLEAGDAWAVAEELREAWEASGPEPASRNDDLRREAAYFERCADAVTCAQFRA